MNAVTLLHASAYRQLRGAEKAYVDAFVSYCEKEAARTNDRISNFLYRPIQQSWIDASNGLIEKPLIKAAISERINELAAASELTVARIIKELTSIAFASHADYMEIGEDGFPRYDLTRCTPEQLAALKTVKFKESMSRGVELEYALHDKMAALKMLSEFTGMMNPDNPHWRATQARPVHAEVLPASTTAGDAANAYGRLLNGK